MPIFVQNISKTELRISFISPFSLDEVSKIKTIKGRRWYPIDRYWSVSFSEETLKYLTRVFAKEVFFESFIQSKDSNSTFETDQFSNSKVGCPDFLNLHEDRLNKSTNITNDKSCKETDKHLEFYGKNDLSKGTKETRGLCPLCLTERGKYFLRFRRNSIYVDIVIKLLKLIWDN